MTGRGSALHLGADRALFAAQFVLPAYHAANLTRIMVLAIYAMGYNLLFGYTGPAEPRPRDVLRHRASMAAGLPPSSGAWPPAPAFWPALAGGGGGCRW